MQKKEYSLEIGGRTLTATFSDLADQATGSVIMKYGETVILVTAVMSDRDKESDYFPLVVDYEERFYAAGRILGGRFIRREGRPSDEAILTGRLVDRTIRPLFDQRLRREVQVVVTVLSIDEENDPDILGIIGASLAIGTSSIPFEGPASAVRVGLNRENEEIIINPVYAKTDERLIEILLCGKGGLINMIEAQGREIGEETIEKLLAKASEELEKIEDFQKKIIAEIGQAKEEIQFPEVPGALIEHFQKQYRPRLFEAIFKKADKHSHLEIKRGWLEDVTENFPEVSPSTADWSFDERVDEMMHQEVLERGRRFDGRALDEIRPIFTQAGGLSNVVHGTGIFYRGGTHVITILTLGGPRDSQIIEGMEVRGKKHFMHHYNFPPFSTGETGRLGGLNRRAVGHGILAEKALKAILPPHETFPYTVRLVSESTASYGSTSMASVCASTLALMDGGVPISRPAAGIAMGLMMNESGNYKILTDICGPEDHHGDMDFKVAGTEKGVTAIQLDIKIEGVPLKILSEALAAAKKARLSILEKIKETIAGPRPQISPNAPRILIHKILPEQIGLLIGSGGKTINGIAEATSAEIEIEEDGTVYVSGKNDSAAKAVKMIENLFHEYKVGEKFDGIVSRLLDFGAFVKIGPNAEGLVHISEIAPFRIERVSALLKEGDVVPVVIKEIDEKNRINLSIKEIDPEFARSKGAKPTAVGYNRGDDRPKSSSRSPRGRR